MSDKLIPINRLNLNRYPETNDGSLRAWNAADEYLFECLHEHNFHETDKLLIINDQFGALTCGLINYEPYYWTDSLLSRTAIQLNLNSKANARYNSTDSQATHIDQCENFIPEDLKFDLVIIRVPKHNSLLKFQLKSILPHIKHSTKILSAGMTRDIHNSNLKLYETIIGTTRTSLAMKKARLIFTNLDKKPEYTCYQEVVDSSLAIYKIPEYDLTSVGFSGVFSRDSLDIGTRVLLQFMPKTKPQQKLIDLGCGTGVLGTYAAKQNSELEVTFTDESWLAVASAVKTFHANIEGNANFSVTNVLNNLADNHYDHILCNPPFHQQNVQTSAIADKMFKDSALKLNSNGELRVVANRHLPYENKLQKYFSSVEILSKDPKFNVWLAKDPKDITAHKTDYLY